MVSDNSNMTVGVAANTPTKAVNIIIILSRWVWTDDVTIGVVPMVTRSDNYS